MMEVLKIIEPATHDSIPDTYLRAFLGLDGVQFVAHQVIFLD